MLIIQVKTGQWCRRSWSRRRSHLVVPESVTCRSKVSVFMLQFLFFSSKQPNILCYKLPVSKVVKNLLPRYEKMRKQGPMERLAVQKYKREQRWKTYPKEVPRCQFFLNSSTSTVIPTRNWWPGLFLAKQNHGGVEIQNPKLQEFDQVDKKYR